MNKTKILLVEDERIAAEDLKVRLQRLNCEIVGLAASGKEAQELAQSQQPDIVLMDINLRGDLDGIETARLIHEQCPVPIIFATAFGDEAHINQALAVADPYGFLHKPVHEETARTMIKIALARFEKDQEILRINHLLNIKDQIFSILQSTRECAELVEDTGAVLKASSLFQATWIVLFGSNKSIVFEVWNGMTKKQIKAYHQVMEQRESYHDDVCDPEIRLSEILDESAHVIPILCDHNLIGEYGFTCRGKIKAGKHETAILKDIGRGIGQSLHERKLTNESHAAQQQITETSAHLKAIIEQSSTGIYLVNDKFEFEYVNDRLCDILGRPREEIIGHNFTEFLGDSREIVTERYAARQRNETVPSEYEIDIIRPGGYRRNLIISANAFTDAQGKRKNTGHLMDITDQKRLNLELTKLSQAVEQSPVMTVITDADGTIEYVNTQFTRVTGYTSEEALGQNPRILNSGQHDVAFYKDMWDTIKAGRIWSGELTNKMKNGEFKWEKVSIAPIRNSEKVITHFVALKEDITEHKIEQTLAARHQLLRNIQYEIAYAAIRSTDASTLYEKIYHFISQIISTSNFYMAILNHDNNRIYFPFDRDLFNADMPESIPCDPQRSLTAKVIVNGETLHLDSDDIQRFKKSGEVTLSGDVPSVWLGIPLKVNQEVIGAFVLQEYDGITHYDEEDVRVLDLAAGQVAQTIDRARKDHELRVLADELRSANGMKELLLDVITHDLRNPAGVISSITEMLETEDSENELFEILNNSSISLMQVIENATVLSKLSLGESIATESLDLVVLIKQIADEFESQLATAGMQIKLELPEHQQMEVNQIICEIPKNYISNAIKYAQAGGVIAISLKSEDGHVVLRVEDQGKLIPSDKREAIFQRSVQLEKGQKRGRGLGLAIVRRIAEAHAATVGVEASSRGGNSFYLKF